MKYRCDVCGRIFNNAADCKEHEKAHEWRDLYGTMRALPDCPIFMPIGSIDTGSMMMIEGIAITMNYDGVKLSLARYSLYSVSKAPLVEGYKIIAKHIRKLCLANVLDGEDVSYEEWRARIEDGVENEI